MSLFVLAPPAPAQVVAQVQAAYRQTGDLEAAFTQIYTDKLRGKKREESGRLWAKPDGRVRWSYTKPVRKDFVFDGTTAYFYEPENAQVTVFDRFQDSPLSNALRFLWGQGDLAAVFTVKECATACDAAAGELAVELWPKEQIPTVEHTVLFVDAKSFRVSRSLVFDPLGNRTEYRFSDMSFHADVADAKFKFEPPKGVDILRADAGPSPNK